MPVSDRQLEDALKIAARVIDLYGDAYWPIFDRLEHELDLRRNRSARLNSYLEQRTTSRSVTDSKPASLTERKVVH